jgi:predicted nucleic acid-binding protein
VVTRGLADTTVFVAGESGRTLEVAALPDDLAVSVVTIGELRAGVLAAADSPTRVRRLRTLTRALALDPVPVDIEVADAWAALRLALRDAGRRMPVNDSWIAATAVVLGVPVVTQDADFPDVGGVEVLRV